MDPFPEIFTIVDTETTGMRPTMSRVIDIGIIRVEHGKVVERFETLLNPGTEVPRMIEHLTDIRSEDLRDAPTFEEVALQVEALFKDSVLVAHNASFDYRFLQSEFARLDMPFKVPTLCTVSLSRKLFPKERAHNLDALIARHGLTCSSRHRAMPDAEVLEQFIEQIRAEVPEEKISESVQHILAGSSRSMAPSKFSNLPEGAGVYFFYGPDDELLYIGKSKNVRTRARSHFSKSSEAREKHIQVGTTAIETISTTGELSALLLESALIKDESPVYNRMLRKRKALVVALRSLDENGYARVNLSREEALSADPNILGVFKTTTQAKVKLRELAKEHRLCGKLLGVEGSGSGACFGSQIQACDGPCTGILDPEIYNERIDEAFKRRRLRTWPYAGVVRITEEADESSGSVFFIRDWVLLGAFRYSDDEFTPLLPGNTNFDYDQYKILVRFMLNRTNKRAIHVLSEREFTKQYAHCTGTYEVVL